jgi:hypothetical protein
MLCAGRALSDEINVSALNGVLTMHEKFHRHEIAPNLNPNERCFNPL